MLCKRLRVLDDTQKIHLCFLIFIQFNLFKNLVFLSNNNYWVILLLGRKAMTNLDSILKSRDITLPTEVRLVKAMVLPVVMYGCESWTVKKAVPKNWCFWTVMLEKTLESPLGCKIKPVHPIGNQSWIFFGRTDVEAEAPILWPPDAKN